MLNNSEDDFLLTSSDLLNIYKRNKRRIWCVSFTFGLLVLVYCLTQPVRYFAEATFREKGKASSGISKSLSEIFSSGEHSDSQALTTMKSRTIMEYVVKKLGLQATIAKEANEFPFFPFKNVRDNLLTEYALLKNHKFKIVKDPLVELKAKSVVFQGEFPLSFGIVFTSENSFNVMAGKKKIGEGLLDAPFVNELFTFTLTSQTANSLEGNKYHLNLQPLGPTAQSLSKKVIVENDRLDKNLIKIAYKDPDRFQATAVVDGVMESYQEYIRNEYQRVCDLQVAYLLQRQREMGKELERVIKIQAHELASDLSMTGFATSEKAMNFLASNQQNFKQQLLTIDLEIERLSQLKNRNFSDLEVFSSNKEEAIKLATEIRALKQQADALRLALRNSSINSQASQEMFFSLNAARDLYIGYSKELSELESQGIQQRHIIGQIHDPKFEISSLSTVLRDPISMDMISKATTIALALKDKENRSQKEQERLQAEMVIQKEFLTSHLKNAASLLDLNSQHLREKIHGLQSINLSLIQDQISILEGQLIDYISSSIDSLKQERNLIERSLNELKSEMALLPQKWAAEQIIDQQMKINQALIEEISKLVESKSISNNLEQFQSTPLDHPLISIHPKSPHLILFTLIGIVFGAFFSFTYFLVKSAVNGIEASSENLRVAGKYVSGNISEKFSASSLKDPILDTDLNTLRRLITFIASSKENEGRKANSLLILKQRGPDYSFAIAEMMSKMGLKILFFDMCFDSQKGVDDNGLLQYLEGRCDAPKIGHLEFYDKISAGGFCRFANELIHSMKFQDLLKLYQEQYDWIIACSDARIDNGEAEALIKYFPYISITIAGQTLPQLRTYLKLKGASFIMLKNFRV